MTIIVAQVEVKKDFYDIIGSSLISLLSEGLKEGTPLIHSTRNNANYLANGISNFYYFRRYIHRIITFDNNGIYTYYFGGHLEFIHKFHLQKNKNTTTNTKTNTFNGGTVYFNNSVSPSPLLHIDIGNDEKYHCINTPPVVVLFPPTYGITATISTVPTAPKPCAARNVAPNPR
ncbi:hypothetical protein ACTA71_005540 [Dictyostelium dimigraforme]